MTLSPLASYTKAPGAVLDFSVDYTALIGAESIVTSTWTVDAGLTKGVDSISGKATTVWLSGGDLSTTYKAVNRITTPTRTLERTLLITVAHRVIRNPDTKLPFPKDPSDIRDYVLDWAPWLNAIGDTISASLWTVLTSGINKDSQANDTTTATVTTSGGSADTLYQLLNHITTAGGRQDERLFEINAGDL